MRGSVSYLLDGETEVILGVVITNLKRQKLVTTLKTQKKYIVHVEEVDTFKDVNIRQVLDSDGPNLYMNVYFCYFH